MFDNILKGEGNKKLAEIGQSDLIVGIPTFKNARTVGHVVQTAGLGLAGLAHLKPLLAIVDGGSSDETLAVANAVNLPASVRRVTGLYPGMMGKGMAVRALFEMARALRARVLVLLEADLQSMEANWVQRMAVPILTREYDMTLPLYQRALTDNAVNDLIAYPLVRTLFGVDLRQPMAGEFAVSGPLAIKLLGRDVWETDVSRHGIDIWVAVTAINDGVRICQVHLSPKLDISRELMQALDPTFIQAVGTLFRMLEIYRKRWPEQSTLRQIPIYGDATPSPRRNATSARGRIHPAPPPLPMGDDGKTPIAPPTLEELADGFRSGTRRYARVLKTVLSPTNMRMIRQLAEDREGAYHFPLDLWVSSVYDFAVVYNKGEGDPDKVAAALQPLCFARVATILCATGTRPDGIEKMLLDQCERFNQGKRYLVQRWGTYVPWGVDGVR